MVTTGMSTYQSMCIDSSTILWKFGEYKCYSKRYNAAKFCDIIFGHRTEFPSCNKNSAGNQKFGHVLVSTKIIYVAFSKNSSPHKVV